MSNNNDNNKLSESIQKMIMGKIPKLKDSSILKKKEVIKDSLLLMQDLYGILNFGHERLEHYKEIVSITTYTNIILIILEEFISSFYDENLFDEEGNPNWDKIKKFGDNNSRKIKDSIRIKEYLSSQLKKRPKLKQYLEDKDMVNILTDFKSLFDDIMDNNVMKKEDNLSLLDYILEQILLILSDGKIETSDLNTLWFYIDSIVDKLIDDNI